MLHQPVKPMPTDVHIVVIAPVALEHLSRQEGVTLFMTLLAAFEVLLCRYTSQEDIVVGYPGPSLCVREHACRTVVEQAPRNHIVISQAVRDSRIQLLAEYERARQKS